MQLLSKRALGCGASEKVLAAVALSLTLTLVAGCGHSEQGSSAASPLLQGAQGETLVVADLAPAARLATRFARYYARTVYERRPPRLPGATRALTQVLSEAATRVPASRRKLHPRLLGIALSPLGSHALEGTVDIGDGRSPPFSVGFRLARRGSAWRVVSASPPS